MTRTDVINYFIKKFNYTSYLEIGIFRGENWRNVKCKYKTGVDPAPKMKDKTDILQMSSDMFFRDHADEFDIIFIDGLHHASQVKKDILNSLMLLARGGTILIHDCLPPGKEEQEVPRTTSIWTGDVWRAFAHYRKTLADYDIFCIDTDYGIGVIRHNPSGPFRNGTWWYQDGMSYEDFAANQKEILNLISVKEFKKYI